MTQQISRVGYYLQNNQTTLTYNTNKINKLINSKTYKGHYVVRFQSINKIIQNHIIYPVNLQLNIVYPKSSILKTIMSSYNSLQNNNKRLYSILQANRFADIFQKAFLKPVQIALKDQNSRSLPAGLSILSKGSISLNKYEQHSIPVLNSPSTVPIKQRYQYITSNMMDNMISLKKMEQNIEFAICVTMKDEDKDTVELTISSIKKSIVQLIKQGIPPESIVIVLIIDGITNLHESMFAFFESMQKESNIFFEDSDHANLMDHQLEKDIEDYQLILNLNKVLFPPLELEQLKNRRIISRYHELQQVEILEQQIRELVHNKSITYEDISNLQIIKSIFLQNAKKRRKQDYGLDELELKLVDADLLIKSYGDNKAVIKNTLNEARNYCSQYKSSRQRLALLSCYRSHIPSTQKQTSSKNIKKMNESTTNLKIDSNPEEGIKQKTFPINLFTICKYQESGKLSSHSWFLNGICEEIKPRYIIMMEAGSKIQSKGLIKVYHEFQSNERLGGLCGYQVTDIEKSNDQFEKIEDQIDCLSVFFHQVFNIQRAEQFRNHFSNIVDRSYESLTVNLEYLPGPLYALRSRNLQRICLQQYFKPLFYKQIETNTQIINQSACKMILRVILPSFIFNQTTNSALITDQSLLVITNRNSENLNRIIPAFFKQQGFSTKIIPNLLCPVKPKTVLEDVCRQVSSEVKSLYAVTNLQNTQNQYNNSKVRISNWISEQLLFIFPSIFLLALTLALNIVARQFIQKIISSLFEALPSAELATISQAIVNTISFSYSACIFGFIFYAVFFKIKYNRFTSYIYGVSTFFGILTIFIFIVLIVKAIKFFTEQYTIEQPIIHFKEDSQLGLVSITYFLFFGFVGLHFLALFFYSLLYCKIHIVIEIIIGFFSYLFYLPTYCCLFYLYGVCKLDQIQFNQEHTTQKFSLLKEAWLSLKIIEFSKYVFWNIAFSAIFTFLVNQSEPITYIVLILLILYCITPTFKVVLSIVYLFKERILSVCRSNKKREENYIPKTDTPNDYNYLSKLGILEPICEQIKNNMELFGEDLKNLRANKEGISSIRITGGSLVFRQLRKRDQIVYRKSQQQMII